MASTIPPELPSLATTTASTSTNSSMPASPGSASTTVVDGNGDEKKIGVDDLAEEIKEEGEGNPEVCISPFRV